MLTGVHTEIIYWEWPLDTGTTQAQRDKNDEQDTKDVKNNFTMDITVTGVQVIEDVDVNKVTTLLAGSDFNKKISALAGGPENIYAFEKAPEMPNLDDMDDKNIISADEPKSLVYAWFDEIDGTIYYWSEDSHIYLNANSSGMYKGLTNIKSIDTVNLDTSKVANMSEMFYECESLNNLDLSKFNTSKVTDMSYLFYACSSLTEIDVSNFDTSNVTTMSYMFAGKASDTIKMKLANIKGLTSFNTSNVEDMSYMFYMCINVTELDVSSFNTSKVINMSYMFGGAWVNNRQHMKLTKINGIESFANSNVKDMSYMFGYCNQLTSLDLSDFKTGNVTNMTGMFEDCSSLITLDLNNFDTRNVTNMSRMFRFCHNLESLNISSFNTDQVTHFGMMFGNCYSLNKLNITNFNTSNATSMNSMFEQCRNLKDLDLSSFDTSKVKNMNSMFALCYNLTTIYVSNKFSINSGTSSTGMFNECTSLQGGAGTKYLEESEKEGYADIDYARIDGKDSKKGFFSERAGQ